MNVENLLHKKVRLVIIRRSVKDNHQNITASASEIEFVDCGEKIKLEIKEETETEVEMKTLEDVLTVKSEICEDIVESDEISLESELEAKSIDCKETIKLEVKEEIQETEDLLDPIFSSQS